MGWRRGRSVAYMVSGRFARLFGKRDFDVVIRLLSIMIGGQKIRNSRTGDLQYHEEYAPRYCGTLEPRMTPPVYWSVKAKLLRPALEAEQ